MKIVGILAALGFTAALIGMALFWTTITAAKSAPQEASLSAMVLAGVVPPYILARCWEMITMAKKGEAAEKSEKAAPQAAG